MFFFYLQIIWPKDITLRKKLYLLLQNYLLKRGKQEMKHFSKIVFIITISFLIYSCKSNKPAATTAPPPPIVEVEVPPPPPNKTIVNFLSEYLNLKYKEKSFEKYMYVSIKYQHLYLIENDVTTKKYPISTAAKGVGNKQGSNKTPYGLAHY